MLTTCPAAGAPAGRAAAPLLTEDFEALLVELSSGYIAFHTAQGMEAWINAHYGSWAAAPVLRAAWIYHQPQLDRLGLAFGTNLAWGD